VVIPELKFGDVERQIFAADLVTGADNVALPDRPKAFNRVGVNCANGIIALGKRPGMTVEILSPIY
jgi:hypothetical protein